MPRPCSELSKTRLPFHGQCRSTATVMLLDTPLAAIRTQCLLFSVHESPDRVRLSPPIMNQGNVDAPIVVVIGGGFGGVAAVQALANAPVNVVLIDKENHHLFQPLLYQVATSVLPTSNILSDPAHLSQSDQRLCIQRRGRFDRLCCAPIDIHQRSLRSL